jgi:glutamate synthase domain-containing protein 3
MNINANGIYYRELNETVYNSEDKEIVLENVCGQRYIGTALSDYHIEINGTPGNGLAQYMNNSTIVVNGNAQDATGDTMNLGKVIIHGRCGDTCGYAMRGGEIYVRDDTGYRTGIHMKEYKELHPVVVIGGKSGDFLGEYLAGGIIIVLGLGMAEVPVGRFCGTGMHGGVIYLRCDTPPADLPKQVNVEEPTEQDLLKIKSYVQNFCTYFGGNVDDIMKAKFIKLIANSKNPYKQLYTNNW